MNPEPPEDDATFTARLLQQAAQAHDVHIDVIHAMSIADCHIEAILVTAQTALAALDYDARLRGEETPLAVRQTIDALDNLRPIRLHHAIHTDLDALLQPPTTPQEDQ